MSGRIYVLLATLFVIVVANAKAEEDVKININGDDAVATGLRFFVRLYDDCSKKDGLSPCLKMKAITFFDRAMRTPEIPLTDSLILVKNGSPAETSSGPQDQQQMPVGRSLTEAELEATLPRGNYEAKDMQLNELLLDRIARFFNSYKVQIALPKLETTELKRNLEEGRGKMKKMMGMMMMGLAMKAAAIVPIALGGLFLLAGKALIISKIALVLSLIIALKKLLSQKNSGGGHHEMHHGWQSSGGGGGGGWDRRSLKDGTAAHQLAYRAQAPAQQ
ncbi:uncharacterized protein Osi12 [Periplaneta americana]|uniref:uncharacterized protein Osi12 n=1 Tax=Periplaneta americana TaxID=6978 RepID=UPI0037E7B9F6